MTYVTQSTLKMSIEMKTRRFVWSHSFSVRYGENKDGRE